MPKTNIVEQYGASPTAGHKSWVFTLNNYTPGNYRTIMNLMVNRRAVGKEVGENGTPHLQGLLVFPKPYRFDNLKKILPRCHLQKCNSFMHAWNYCLKEGDFVCEDNTRQGERTDIQNYRNAIRDGATDRELCDQHPHEFLKFTTGTIRMRNAYINPRTEMTQCIWIHGPAGSGKSTMVKTKYPDCEFLEYDGRYFSHYQNKDVVVFDDMDLGLLTRELFLKLINHIPYKIRIMRDYQEWNAKLVIIISNDHPDLWRTAKGLMPYDKPEVRRRITDIQYYDFRDTD